MAPIKGVCGGGEATRKKISSIFAAEREGGGRKMLIKTNLHGYLRTRREYC